jgi:hypothetical protein
MARMHTMGWQDGKPAGWHDYEAAASDIVEAVYQNWQDDKTLNVRCVQVSWLSSSFKILESQR